MEKPCHPSDRDSWTIEVEYIPGDLTRTDQYNPDTYLATVVNRRTGASRDLGPAFGAHVVATLRFNAIMDGKEDALP